MQLKNQLIELQNGDSKKADTKNDLLKKELGQFKKIEKDLKKRAAADAALISKHEDTIAAMILQSDLVNSGSGNIKISQKRGGKQREIASGNESDSSASGADATIVVQKTKKRSRGKAAVGVEVNGSSSDDDAKGRTCIYVSNNLSTYINRMIILHGRVTQIFQEGDYHIVEECFKVGKSQRSALLFRRSSSANGGELLDNFLINYYLSYFMLSI